VAREILGFELVRIVEGKRLSGIIVEAEAYRGNRDPASHAYMGRTKRNEVMFGEAGHAYVYFSYGFHHLLNITTESPGIPGAVLIRALEPRDGVSEMAKNRGLDQVTKLTSGPGMLTQALRIDRALNGEDIVSSSRLFVEQGSRVGAVGTTSRVGIKNGGRYKWRFYVIGNPFVSKGRPSSTNP
jgi:DNA-3-methyladenine glycosylase